MLYQIHRNPGCVGTFLGVSPPLAKTPCPMLSTGFKDKDKRECYEDDIVSVKHSDGEVVKCLIFSCPMGLGMRELDGWDSMTETGPLRVDAEWTYLGNKWEDPELMEE